MLLVITFGSLPNTIKQNIGFSSPFMYNRDRLNLDLLLCEGDHVESMTCQPMPILHFLESLVLSGVEAGHGGAM